MPYLLALNAAEGLLQLVIARVEPPVSAEPAPLALTRLCAMEWHAPSQGVELLVPALQDACARLHITPKDIGHIACVNGPGSFTGLRLVLSTASGLARATGATLAGMPYLALLALGAANAALPLLNANAESAPVMHALTHARRNLIHMQTFTAAPSQGPSSPAVRPDGDIMVLSLEDAAAHIKSIMCATRGKTNGHNTLLLGNGLTRNLSFWQNAELPGVCFLPPCFDRPDPDIMLRVAAGLVYEPKDIAPQYVRPCDAEENLVAIARSLGLDPGMAEAALARLTGRE